jgi:hypothetical protein
MIAPSGTYTDRNFVTTSTSLTDLSTTESEYTQSNTAIDGSTDAIGLAAHFTGRDDEFIHDEEHGYVTIMFDGVPQRPSPGWHQRPGDRLWL